MSSFQGKKSLRMATAFAVVVGASAMAASPALAVTHKTTTKATTPKATTTATTVVSRLSLSTGPQAGGGKIVISGTKLATSAVVDGETVYTAKTVKFGDVTVASNKVTALSEKALEVEVPAAASVEKLKVSVLVGDATKGPNYVYVAAPVTVTTDQDDLDAMAPKSEDGLKAQEIVGTAFSTKNTKLEIGGKAVSKPTITTTKITFDFPAGLTGVQDVVVADPRGDVYVGYVTYTAKKPTISAMSLTYVLKEGPTAVTLTGTNLDVIKTVTYEHGDVSDKAGFTKTTDPTKLTVTVPKGDVVTGGKIKVATAYDESALSPAIDRKASATPTVSAVTGAVAAGGVVTLTGTNLIGLKAVSVASTTTTVKTYKGSDIKDVTATSAKVKLPAMPDNATYKLTATTLASAASTAFSFDLGTVVSTKPTVTTATPNTDGTSIVVVGTNLTGVTKAVITPTSGSPITVTTGFTSNTATGVTIPVSALETDTYGIVVTTASGDSVSKSFDFTAPAPVVTDPTLTAAYYDTAVDPDPARLTLEGTDLEVGTHVRWYPAAGDASAAVEDTVDGVGTDAANVDLADVIEDGEYKVEVSADGSTWSDAVDLTVANS